MSVLTLSLPQAIKRVMQRDNLTDEEMTQVMQQIMTGQATDAQIGGFLIGLAMKGETVAEITAAAKVMRQLATPVTIQSAPIIDTCGTGGDGASSFNVSTASAFVVAAAGAKVAKHGNRSVSSTSGSADVLEAAGVNLDISPEQVAHCIETVGIGFIFAQKHHGAMKHAIAARKEMAVRTIFNLLGPLTNPAGAPYQVLGVYDRQWLRPVAEVLQQLGSRHVLVVHSADGMDEISIGAETTIAELKDGKINEYTIQPEDFGLQRADITALSVNNVTESLAMIQSIFAGHSGPARDIVVLNAGAAIYAADLSDDLASGIQLAQNLIDNGVAAKKLDALIQCSQGLTNE
ncbi:Anthranilate phosphoribosyltransferase [Methylophaga frappieri]|uniref:Anthranilate phosphoribosyltransferase n=1 Tax=Methylophaga frappieri (strain ATCC BAA-2434 / DSM 25690 / JAM7) TaxID=754477 RepID=I1YEQ1_METFJ|nr:anthranilate phosphoribosyltransferase [Methylophaga frappieri]AFJ01394.1 Anthranilate phosphoribosyltransferase [Methylophaga frappieri]